MSIRANRILVLKDGAVIAERYEHPYVNNSWDCVFSATKTVTTLALGALYDETGLDLDTPACKLLGVENKVGNLQNKKITLRHLLTMSTGNAFNELESASSKKWIADYFNSANKFGIGKKFDYNSLNTYIIGAIIEKLTGRSLSDYIQEKIFDKLDISKTYFERSPEGIAKSGWGLYILPEDMAKLGILMRDYGVYNNECVISEEWIREMSKKEYEATAFGHRFDYGYQMWVKESANFCCFNGMYNQDILIYRNTGIVIVTCCANNEAFHGSNMYAIAEKYFAYDIDKNFSYVNKMGSHDAPSYQNLHYYYDTIVGQKYTPMQKIANSCGILPLILQNEMGTYVKGVRSLAFDKNDNECTLTIMEGSQEYSLRFNFAEGIRQSFDFYNNLYDCVVDGRFFLSAKGEPYFVVRVFFLEFASTRYISFKFGKNNEILSVEFSENPGIEFIQALLETQDKATKKLIDGAMKLIDKDLLYVKTKNIFSPSFTAKLHKEKTEE
ncbi:MAG: serine hydrolase [Clostridia bacterium]|nr:serine hydrolase [Clostridia bacterium]